MDKALLLHLPKTFTFSEYPHRQEQLFNFMQDLVDEVNHHISELSEGDHSIEHDGLIYISCIEDPLLKLKTTLITTDRFFTGSIDEINEAVFNRTYLGYLCQKLQKTHLIQGYCTTLYGLKIII